MNRLDARRRGGLGTQFEGPTADGLMYSDTGGDSNETHRVVSRGDGPRESFADAFVGEFLMPSEGVRRFVEEVGIPPRIVDATDAVHIQRYFGVSWPTALVRLRRMNVVTPDAYRRLRDSVRPVSLSRSLRNSIHPEEYAQDAGLWRIHNGRAHHRPPARGTRSRAMRDRARAPGTTLA